MIKKIKFYFILTIIVFTFNNVFASQSNYFSKGKSLFDSKNFEKSKFFFEKDIVFNPKNANSYLYLAKIFNIKDEKYEEEKNLETLLMLEPSNEEGMVMLMHLKLEDSNFSKAKLLLKQFKEICVNLCSEEKLISDKLKSISETESK